MTVIETQPRPEEKKDIFPNKYKDILEIYPRYPTESDQCCDYCTCLVCSPMVVLVWTGCFLGVTAKKMKNCCCFKQPNITIIPSSPKTVKKSTHNTECNS